MPQSVPFIHFKPFAMSLFVVKYKSCNREPAPFKEHKWHSLLNYIHIYFACKPQSLNPDLLSRFEVHIPRRGMKAQRQFIFMIIFDKSWCNTPRWMRFVAPLWWTRLLTLYVKLANHYLLWYLEISIAETNVPIWNSARYTI